LQNDLQGWFNETFVRCAAAENGSLAGESSGCLQAALNCHQAKLLREIVRVDRAESLQPALFEKEEPVRAQLRQRRQARLAIEQKRDEIITRRSHARVLVIHDTHSLSLVDH